MVDESENNKNYFIPSDELLESDIPEEIKGKGSLLMEKKFSLTWDDVKDNKM